jgi:cytochrome P450
MSYDDVHVQYQGFHPSDFTKSFIRSLLEEIHDEAPSGASVRAIFSKKDGNFKGTINVRSAAGPFFAMDVHSSLIGVAEHLLRQMRRKLDRWKSNRFKRDRITRSTFKSFEREDDYGTGVA